MPCVLDTATLYLRPTIMMSDGKRKKSGEDGEVPETPELSWQRKTFFVALDTILGSMRRRFDKNRSLFEILAIFAPSNFTYLVKSGKSTQDLHCIVADKFHLNTNQ